MGRGRYGGRGREGERGCHNGHLERGRVIIRNSRKQRQRKKLEWDRENQLLPRLSGLSL